MVYEAVCADQNRGRYVGLRTLYGKVISFDEIEVCALGKSILSLLSMQ